MGTSPPIVPQDTVLLGARVRPVFAEDVRILAAQENRSIGEIVEEAVVILLMARRRRAANAAKRLENRA